MAYHFPNDNNQIAILGSGSMGTGLARGGHDLPMGVYEPELAQIITELHGVEMRISQDVVKIVDGELTLVEATTRLMTRKLRYEREL